MEPMTQFEPGTAVTWLSVPRGGYGYVWPVDGVVVRRTSVRVIIRVTTRTGQQVERAVRPETLRLRREQEEEAGADEERAQALVDVLRGVLHPEHVWREQLSARWVVFVRHEEQTYCLLPLHYGGTEGDRCKQR